MYVGRFAPSPTGALHFGSLVAALASWLDARAARGRWLIRIEDLDPPREQAGAAELMLRTLEGLGLAWDGPVVYQSLRAPLYEAALEKLRPYAYRCGCTRREIADSSLGLAADGARIYPGTCRPGLPPGRSALAWRLRTSAEAVAFRDRVQGPQSQVLAAQVGDFVLYRADRQFSYQIAVVVDDAAQGITDVVRGADLLDSTARQIYLQRLLGLPTPRYLHVPVVLGPSGDKVSKQNRAQPIDLAQRDRLLRDALRFLGQPETCDLEEAIAAWDPGRIPRRRASALAAG
jgi:glutamyl-Q tRNA(Asp) synthetase